MERPIPSDDSVDARSLIVEPLLQPDQLILAIDDGPANPEVAGAAAANDDDQDVDSETDLTEPPPSICISKGHCSKYSEALLKAAVNIESVRCLIHCVVTCCCVEATTVSSVQALWVVMLHVFR